MTGSQLSEAGRWAATLVLAGALALGACVNRPVGSAGGGNQNTNQNNGDPDDAGAPLPDAGTSDYTGQGWIANSFEHQGYTPAADLDPGASAGLCGIVPRTDPAGETWWVRGIPPEGLSRYPSAVSWDKLGLFAVNGALSAPGEYGHMGAYPREIGIAGSTLLVCPTVQVLGHCVVPRPADVCTTPSLDEQPREIQTWEIYPPPPETGLVYDIELDHSPDVADGQTIVRLRFALPYPVGDSEGWENFDVEGGWVTSMTLTEERHWEGFAEVPYSPLPEGWVMRNVGERRIMVSIRGLAPNDAVLHVWGDFAIDGTIIVD